MATKTINKNYGPVNVTATPSETESSIMVTVSLDGEVITENNLTPQSPNLQWNAKVGNDSSNGLINARFPGGSLKSSLWGQPINWDSQDTGPGNFTGRIDAW
jgi:hypothetical protein